MLIDWDKKKKRKRIFRCLKIGLEGKFVVFDFVWIFFFVYGCFDFYWVSSKCYDYVFKFIYLGERLIFDFVDRFICGEVCCY